MADIQRNFFERRERTLLLLLLIFLSLAWLRGITVGEVHLMVDETRHAVSGVFVLDFLRDLPWKWPLLYAYEYYGKYPAFSLGYWPPAFYVVEAAFFALFGISAWASRLAVILFALVAAILWYKIVRCHAQPEVAATTVVVYASLPAVLLYEKSTMLEIPTLALCLAALYCWLGLLRTERPAYLYATALFAAWALLTKQTAVFLAPFFLLHLIVERKWFLLKWRHTYLALAGVAAIVAPWQLLVMKLHPQAVLRATPALGKGWAPSLSAMLTYYPTSLPDQLGLPLLTLSLLGIATAVWARERAGLRFFLPWILASYLVFTPLIEKSPRYILAWLLPFLYFAVYFVWRVLQRWSRLRVAALAGLALSLYVPALAFERPYVEGCEQAARFLAQQPDADIVFYQGRLNGDFIFFVRKFDPQKRRVVVREKMIMDSRNKPVLHSPEEVEQLFNQLGIRYIVVEDKDFAAPLRITRQALQSPPFELVKQIPIRTNDFRLAGVNLLVYRNKSAARSTDKLTIPMVTLREDVHLWLPRVAGKPWPPQRGSQP